MRPFAFAGALALAGVPAARAELAWSPSTGWELQGGTLSGLAGPQGRAALKLMNKARQEEEHGSLHMAIKSYEAVARKYSGSVYAPEAEFRAAQLLERRKQYYDSFKDYQRMLRSYPNSRRFSDAIGELYRIAAMLEDGAHNWAWGWLPMPSDRLKATEYLQVIIIDAPYSDYAPLALMEEARGFQREKESEEGIDALDRLVNTYPNSVLAPVAYLRLGDLHASMSEGPKYDQASTKEAMTYYEDYMILYPGDTGIREAASGVDRMKTILAQSKIYIGDYYFYKRLNFVAARVFYNEAITAYPDSAAAGQAKKRLAALESRVNKLRVGPAAHKKRFWFF
ncbi:MAG TPA: outer membrane protein assembly factor BamD [Opitutaceae bacterium]|jgi:outer membrane protein assembly factor BamD